jgi:hypothetical protein
MFDVLAIRNGMSYNSLLASTHPRHDGSGYVSEEPIINEHTIAYFLLCMICSLDAGITLRRQKKAMYELYVSTLKALNGQGGRHDWRS